MTTTRALIICDGAEVPPSLAKERWQHRKPINRRGPAADIHLHADSLAGRLLTHVEDRAADLVHIAAYVYAADQAISRGGEADVFGEDWRRHLALCIPVTDPAFWMQETVRVGLAATLNFLTEDTWDFAFSQGPSEDRQIPFELNEAPLLGFPNVVSLLSGGADSLCATVEAAAMQGDRPLIVSHRPTPPIASRQEGLARLLRHHFPSWHFPHLSFWIHRQGSDAADTSQRSRAFLFACLGTAVAAQLGIERVIMGDNGVVSLNLPISAQLVGALASRSTHPKFLRRFDEFIVNVLPTSVRVENPLWTRTRAEVLEILKAASCQGLFSETVSCGRNRGRRKESPHCGFCLQCVDRRFASIAAGLEDHDLSDGYGLDIFSKDLPVGESRTVPVSYIHFARRLRELTDEGLFLEFPQLVDCLPSRGQALEDTVRSLVQLLRRHTKTTLGVIEEMLVRYRAEIAAGSLGPDSLLALAFPIAARLPPAQTDALSVNVFRKEGDYWEIVFRGQTKRIKDLVGCTYLAYLLSHPGRRVHAQELLAAGGKASPGEITKGWPFDEAPSGGNGVRVGGIDVSHTLIDAKDEAKIRHDMELLREYRDEVLQRGDTDRAAEIDQELEATEVALRAGIGLKGHRRKFGGQSEDARQSVTSALLRTRKHIDLAFPEFGHHLHTALKTGTFCLYAPDPPITWAV